MKIKLLTGYPLANTECWQACHIYLISVKLLIPTFQENKNARPKQLSKSQDNKKQNASQKCLGNLCIPTNPRSYE